MCHAGCAKSRADLPGLNGRETKTPCNYCNHSQRFASQKVWWLRQEVRQVTLTKQRRRLFMKIHKLGLIAVLAVATLAPGPVLRAQESDAKRERPAGTGQRGDAVKERLARMAEELKLT